MTKRARNIVLFQEIKKNQKKHRDMPEGYRSQSERLLLAKAEIIGISK